MGGGKNKDNRKKENSHTSQVVVCLVDKLNNDSVLANQNGRCVPIDKCRHLANRIVLTVSLFAVFAPSRAPCRYSRATIPH